MTHVHIDILYNKKSLLAKRGGEGSVGAVTNVTAPTELTDRSEAAHRSALRCRSTVSTGLGLLGLTALVGGVCRLPLLRAEAGLGEDGLELVVVDRTCHGVTP